MTSTAPDPRQTRRWRALREVIFARDGRACAACGSSERPEVDHITPISLGGDPFDEDNLRVLCQRCNGRRGARPLIRTTWYNPRWFPDGPPA